MGLTNREERIVTKILNQVQSKGTVNYRLFRKIRKHALIVRGEGKEVKDFLQGVHVVSKVNNENLKEVCKHVVVKDMLNSSQSRKYNQIGCTVVLETILSLILISSNNIYITVGLLICLFTTAITCGARLVNNLKNINLLLKMYNTK